ncbi:MAG: choice-of-anchor L domain-containing protein [Bacteroidota bacterium]
MRHFFILTCFTGVLIFFGFNTAYAQLTFNNGQTASQLAQMLAGPGVTVSNATFNCAANAIGSFTGPSSIGFTNGVILTTGDISVASPNTNSGSAQACNNTPGDPQLASNTDDACALEFDIIPLCDTLKFNYVFGSEEYPEWVGTPFNDAFAFYISGPGITGQPNIAKIPGTNTFVTIGNVNSNTNSQYFVTNSGSTIEYDGYTTTLTAWALVQPCQTYHLKIVIADVADCNYDSGVFLEAGSLQCATVVSAEATVQNAVEGCHDGSFQFCRGAASASAITINYTIAGTATNGTDYTAIGNSITIPSGQLCATLPIIPIADGVTEAMDSILIIYQPGPCPTLDTVVITITDTSPLDAGPDAAFCANGNAVIGTTSVPGTTYAWTPTAGLSSSTVSNPTVTLTNTGTSATTTNYILTATTSSCIAKDTVAVIVSALASADAGIDQTICSSSVTLNGAIGGSASVGTWGGGTGIYTPNNTSPNATYAPSSSEIAAGTVTLTLTTDDPPGLCPATNDQVTVTINLQTIISAGADQSICIGNTATLNGSVAGSSSTGTWSGGTGTYNPDNADPMAVYTPSTAEETYGMATLTFTADGSAGPCSAVNDDVVITINQLPTANAGSSQTVCKGTSITLNGSIGGSATSGTWSGGTGTYSPDNTTLNAVYTPSTAEYTSGSVGLTLTTNDPAGPCTFSSSNVTFSFYEKPVVGFSADNTSGCPVHCTNFTNTSSIVSGSSIVTWNWDFGDGSTPSTLQTPSNCFLQSGFYDVTLTATSNNGCVTSLTQSHLVEVFNLPDAEFTPTPNPATILEPVITFSDQSSPDVNYWYWNFGDGNSLASGSTDPVHIYPDSAADYLVTLTVTNTNGCFDSIKHLVTINPAFTFYIPNAFTPNGDGTNDYFFGSGIGIKKYDLWIFDRWGNMIFHGNTLSESWDGKANAGDRTAQADVYVWKVGITDVFNKKHIFVGTVTITR